MDVITLLGSARKKKSNTAWVLGWVEEELIKAGHSVERYDLTRMDINGCLGCAACRKVDDKPGCVQKDDAPALLDRIIRADALIIASPLYFWGFTAQTKAFIDRTYSLVQNYGSPEHTSLVEGRKIGLVVAAADSYEGNGEEIVTSYDRIVDYAKAINCGHLFVGQTGEPAALGEDVQTRAIELAQKIMS